MNQPKQGQQKIWHKTNSLAELNTMSADSLMAHLDINFCDISDSELWANMPVNAQSKQPFGILHGGASVALAESVASMAAWLTLEEGKYPAGLDINANHIKAIRTGRVAACARPVHLGQQSQVWSVDIYDDEKDLVCCARMTLLIQSH
jgi:1,4-dihydroxy-2-naphthoyl-CoA hydrolase